MGKSLSAEALRALNDCTVEGNVVKLGPAQLDRKIYVEVKSALDGIGGSWKSGKVGGFVFPHDPAELLSDLQGGTKRNLQKEFQFFETPPHLAKRLVEMAEINSPDLEVLEPSAGNGAIVKAILAHEPGLCVHGFELSPYNRPELDKIEDFIFLGEDFLNNSLDPLIQFDRIVANPPFNNNQDIAHIYQMYQRLRRGGVLVSIASRHWLTSTNKREVNFRTWLNAYGGDVTDIAAGEFKESGTNIATCIIKFVKP